jgi:hypothetical protein
MAITKTVVVDKIGVLEQGQMEVRTATVISDDGVELARSFSRHVLNPGDDTSTQAQRVQDIAAATWTADVVADWDAWVAAHPPPTL